MNGKALHSKYWLLLLIVILAEPLQAKDYADIYQMALNSWFDFRQQLTTHPAQDTEPAISPDGKWLAFTSTRSGNRDIWIKPLPIGAAVQLTNHFADDFAPCWGGDSHTIYFISRRSDAEGDIWRIRFDPAKGSNGRKLEQVDNYLGYDAQPSCSSDGRWLAFTSTRLSGKKNIWILDLKTENIFPATFNGGRSPKWSPDNHLLLFVRTELSGRRARQNLFVYPFSPPLPASAIFDKENVLPLTQSETIEVNPTWLSNEKVVFLRYEMDTNKDTKIDIADNPSPILLKVNMARLDSLLDIQQKEQLSPKTAFVREMHLFPAAHQITDLTGNDSLIVGTCAQPDGKKDLFLWDLRERNRFVASVLTAGFFDFVDSLFSPFLLEGLNYQRRARGDSLPKETEELFHIKRCFAFQLLREEVDLDSLQSVVVKLRLAELWHYFGRHELAAQLLREATKEAQRYDSLKLEVARSLEGLALLAPEGLFSPSVWRQLQKQFSVQRTVAKARRLVRLDSLDVAETLLLTLNQDSLLKTQKLEFWPTLAEVYCLEKKWQKALKICLRGLKEVSRVPERKKLLGLFQWSLARLAAGQRQTGAFWQNWRKRLPESPDVMAAFEFHHALFLHQQQKDSVAVQKWREVAHLFPEARWSSLEALLQLLSLEGSNRPDSAVAWLDVVLGTKGSTRTERTFFQQYYLHYAQLRAQYLRKSGKTAEAFREFSLIWGRDTSFVDVLADLISTAAELERTDSLEQLLASRLKGSHYKAELLFALGLIRNYQANGDESSLLDAARTLEHALQLNYKMIPAYSCLASIYYQLEQIQQTRLQREYSWPVKAARALFAPIFWAYRKVTFRKPKEIQSWLEQAIETLNLALEITNENQSPAAEARFLQQIGDLYYQMGDYGRAQAFRFYKNQQRYLDSIRNPRTLGTYFLRFGHAALLEQDLALAEYALSQADSIFTILQDSSALLVANYFRAWNSQWKGDYAAAVHFLQRGAAFQNKNTDPQLKVRLWRNLAHAFGKMKNDQKTREYSVRALRSLMADQASTKKNLGSSSVRLQFIGYSFPLWNFASLGGDAARRLFGFSPEDEQAMIFQVLANSAYSHKRLLESRQFLLNKLEQFQKKKDIVGQAVVKNNLGVLDAEQGRYFEAWKWFEASLKLCEKSDLLSGQIVNLVGLTQLAVHFYAQGIQDSLATHQIRIKPKDLIEKIETRIIELAQFPYLFQAERADLFACRGLLRLLPQMSEEALISMAGESVMLLGNDRFGALVSDLETALKYARQADDAGREIYLLQQLGDWLLRAGLRHAALQHYTEALNISRSYGFWRQSWQQQLRLGLASGSDSLRIILLRKAEELLLDGIRYHPEVALSRQEWRSIGLLFSLLTKWEVGRRNYKKALELQVELESLRRVQAFAQIELSTLPEEEERFYQIYSSLLNEIDRLNKRLLEIKRSRRGGYRLFNTVLDSLFWAEDDWRALLQEGEKSYPHVLDLIYPRKVEIQDVQGRLSPYQVLLAFYPHQDGLYSWCVTRDAISFYKAPLSAQDLMKVLESKDTVTVKEITKSIVSPFSALTEEKNEFLIVGETPILMIPFERALHVQSGTAKLAYFPTVLDFLLAKPTGGFLNLHALLVGDQKTFESCAPEGARLVSLPPFSVPEKTVHAVLDTVSLLVIDSPLTGFGSTVLESYLPFRISTSPLKLTYGSLSPASQEDDGFFHLKEILSRPQKGGCAIFFSPQTFTIHVEHVFSELYPLFRNSGFSTLILTRREISKGIKAQFLREFWGNLVTHSPYLAFRVAIEKLSSIHPNLGLQTTFVWFGPPH